MYRRVHWAFMALHYAGALLGLAYLTATEGLSGLSPALQHTPFYLLLWCIVYPGGQAVLIVESYPLLKKDLAKRFGG